MSAALAHRGDLQGLRALAVLLVALGHAGVAGLGGGFVGVDVFFVLSGFLITGLLLAEWRERGRISLAGFYARRARRILPAAALTLVVTDLAAYLLLNFVRAQEVVRDSLYAAAFLANVRFAERETDYFAADEPPSPLLHFWSLAVEEQFYLVWPALLATLLGLAVLGRRRCGRAVVPVAVVALGTASFAWSVHLTAALPEAAYFSPVARAWELALGAALAFAPPALVRLPAAWRLALGWSGVLAICLAATASSPATPFPGYAALLPTVGAALVIAAGVAGAPRLGAGRVLALRPLRAVGDRSYAFYLWHWPVLVIAEQVAGRELSVGANLVLLAGAYALSAASYALFEDPLRRAAWGRRTTGVAVAGSAAAVLVVAGISLQALEAREARFYAAPADRPVGPVNDEPRPVSRDDVRTGGALRAVVEAVRAAGRGDAIPRGLWPPLGDLAEEPNPYALPRGCVPVAASSLSSSRICPLGRTGSRRTLVLVGDSHAQTWLPTLARTAELDGWRLVPLLRPGCTPDTWTRARGNPACRPWYRWATAQVRRIRPDVVVVGGWFAGARGAAIGANEHGVASLARSVARASRRVVVLGDPEGLTRSPVDCILSRGASMARCTATWPRERLEPYERMGRVVTSAGARFLDTRGWFCLGSRCPPVVGRTIVYRDYRHVTAAYALRLVGPFRAELRRIVREPRRAGAYGSRSSQA